MNRPGIPGDFIPPRSGQHGKRFRQVCFLAALYQRRFRQPLGVVREQLVRGGAGVSMKPPCPWLKALLVRWLFEFPLPVPRHRYRLRPLQSGFISSHLSIEKLFLQKREDSGVTPAQAAIPEADFRSAEARHPRFLPMAGLPPYGLPRQRTIAITSLASRSGTSRPAQ